MPYKPGTLAILLCVLLSPISPRAAEVALGTIGGVYTAPVQINRTLTLQFLIDPGAAAVIIPEAVFTELVENGTIPQGDVLGTGIATLADRSSYATLKIRLHELRIGGVVVRDVTAAVSPRLTLPLLGQSLLSRFNSVTFDNRRHALILSGSPAAPQASVYGPITPSYPWLPATALPSTSGYGSNPYAPYGSYGRPWDQPDRGYPAPPY
jgi:hypothetical protein